MWLCFSASRKPFAQPPLPELLPVEKRDVSGEKPFILHTFGVAIRGKAFRVTFRFAYRRGTYVVYVCFG